MAAINENALSKFKGIFEARDAGSTGVWIRLPSVRGLTTTIDNTNIVEIKADDTGTVLKVVDRTANFTFEFLENKNRDNLVLLFGGTSSDVAGTPVAVTAETIGDDLPQYTIYTLENKNGDDTEVASITVSDSGGALVLDTDYIVRVDSQGNTYIQFILATTGATTVDYTYTPNSSENLTLDLTTTELKNFEVRVTGLSEDGLKKTYSTITSATLNSTYSINYADVLEAGDITGATLTFEANKGSQFIFQDENI